MCLAQGPQRSDAGEALPLSHCAPLKQNMLIKHNNKFEQNCNNS